MKIFLWKDVTQKILKPKTTLKRARPVSESTLELKQSVHGREEKHEYGEGREYGEDVKDNSIPIDPELVEEAVSDDDQEKHREALRKHPRFMKRIIQNGYVKVKKAFFIDKKV
jgi:hypothetical protein